MTGNGTPRVVMGNGEGFTTLILTDAESRMIRYCLEMYEKERGEMIGATPTRAFKNGIQRATARIADEFAAEQKRRKALKELADATVQKGKT